MNETDEKIRKFQIYNALLMFGGIAERDLKIMVKDLTESLAEHVTLRIDKDGSFDVHKTKEGKEKSYIRLGKGKLKFNVDATIQKLVESFLQSKVNIHDPLYQDFIVLIPKNEEAFQKFFYETSTRKKDRIIVSSKNKERILESFRKHFHSVKLEEVGQYDFRMALVLTSENEKFAWLLKTDGEYILFGENQMEKFAQELIEVDRSV